jgi:hypothetical protein
MSGDAVLMEITEKRDRYLKNEELGRFRLMVKVEVLYGLGEGYGSSRKSVTSSPLPSTSKLAN